MWSGQARRGRVPGLGALLLAGSGGFAVGKAGTTVPRSRLDFDAVARQQRPVFALEQAIGFDGDGEGTAVQENETWRLLWEVFGCHEGLSQGEVPMPVQDRPTDGADDPDHGLGQLG